jgi:NAD(P)-dependent dehydrogenase (short-subunit alcohol dehydrogenase family)
MSSLPEGYRAVVFGASGGIGAAVGEQLTADRRCATVLGLHRASTPPLELTREETIAAAAEAVAERLGTVHLLFDATGILHGPGMRPEKRLADVAPEALMEAFAVNALGPALLLKHFGHLLPRRGKGIFATISARVGSIGDNRRGGWMGYRVSKAALNQVVRTASIELAFRHRDSVCVALQPGTVATRLSAPYRRENDQDVLTPEESARRMLRVLDGLDASRTGAFLDHAGEPVPW